MERCVWLSPGEDAPVDGYDRVFIGDEACGGFLPTSGFLSQIDAYASSGYKVGIVTPYLTPEWEIDFIALLEKLTNSTEIVVNDVGAFRLVQKSKHIPIIGRLLMRQNTDPAIHSFFRDQPTRDVYDYNDYVRLIHADPPQALADHFASSPMFSTEATALFLSGREEMTVMMDRPPRGMPAEVPRHMRVMLNMDDVLVSILPCRSCADCPNEEVLLGKTRANIPIYRKRNTCYYKAADAPGGVCEMRTPGYVTRQISRNRA